MSERKSQRTDGMKHLIKIAVYMLALCPLTLYFCISNFFMTIWQTYESIERFLFIFTCHNGYSILLGVFGYYGILCAKEGYEKKYNEGFNSKFLLDFLLKVNKMLAFSCMFVWLVLALAYSKLVSFLA